MSSGAVPRLVGGCVAAILVFGGVARWSSPAWARESAGGREQGPRVIEVTASQFVFDPSEIEISLGESVRLLVRSADVEHGIAIPGLGITETIPPGGEPIAIDFVARESGVHQIMCSAFCGTGHGRMRGSLTIVEDGVGGAQPAQGPDDISDLEVDPLEPDFNLIALPTTLRLPYRKLSFRLTHRFTRPLDGCEGHCRPGTEAAYGNLLEDLFGLDSPAQIGLEFRYGLLPGTQVGVYRSNGRKTIQIFGRQNLLWQRGPRGIGLDIQVSFEGLDNLREQRSGAVSAIVSKRVGTWVSVYAQPTWVSNADRPVGFHLTADGEDAGEDHVQNNEDSSLMIGMGARFRMRPTVYLVGEYAPRLVGNNEGANHLSFAIEKRAGGHTFQLNVSNSIGATPGQLAQGASEHDWFLGFNITRKLY